MRKPPRKDTKKTISPDAAPDLTRTASRMALPVRPENLVFARTLREAMAVKNMTHSDLARAVWGTSPDPRGYPVAKNRDRIGSYLAGTGFPSKETLPKLAAALGLSVDELPIPRRSTSTREFSGAGDVVFTMLAEHPGFCLLRVSKLLPIEIGLQIVNLIDSVRAVSPAGGEAVTDTDTATARAGDHDSRSSRPSRPSRWRAPADAVADTPL